ncbi:luciferin sulfotransferase-like [Cylas formicarius]|uniref:luciferin sulfotransferase-like n=1 Tax=Cylas formicarius TaxID=197179 RepID=UPI0029589FF7|nr:luciferin sulfotransferase-like [Cylas formicarius]
MDIIDKGIMTQFDETMETLKEKVLQWDIRKEDIWICSYPKTGTNWLLELVWMLVNDLDYEKALSISMNKRCPFLECAAVTKYQIMNSKLTDHPLEFIDPQKFIEMNKAPVSIKTHLPWTCLPSQIQNGTKKSKVLYMTRNPYDTLLSLHHYVTSYFNYRGTIGDSVRDFLSGEGICCYGSYWDHVISYWQRRKLSNLLIVKYEDFHRDLPEMIRKVSTFLEKPITEKELIKLADHLSFEKMKTNPSLKVMDERYFQQKGAYFYRSGKVGSYKEELSKEQIARLKNTTEEKFRCLVDFETV